MSTRVDTVATRRYGRYVVLEEIGRGSVGVVYRSLDPVIGRTVALKVVRDLAGLSREQREAFKARFRAEGEVAGSLHHPQIVTLYDVGDDYLVMEFLEGQLLRTLVGNGRALEPARALRFARELAHALDFAHGRGIIHRALKPENVMVLPSGGLKVMDFGVARLRSRAGEGSAARRDPYTAPERLAGQRADARSDLFSLAVLVHEMLTGETPATDAIPWDRDESCRRTREALGDRAPVLETALAPDPAQRFSSAREFSEALERAGQANHHALLELLPSGDAATVGTSPAAAGSATVKSCGRGEASRARGRLLWKLGLTAALLAALASWLVWRGPERTVSSGPDQAAREGRGSATAAGAGLPASDEAPAVEPPLAPGGSLLVTSTPPGALVFVAGAERGRTPLLISELPVGPAAVRVERPGASPATRLAWVFPGRSVGLSIPLRPEHEPSRPVDVLSLPDAAELKIDGVEQGRTNAPGLMLDPGFHVLEIRKAGYRPWLRELEVGPDTERVIATLERDSPGDADRLAPR